MVSKPSRRADDVVFHSLLRKKNSIFYVNLALTYVKGPLTEQYWFWLKPIGIVYYCGISEPAPVQSVIDQLLPRRRNFLIPDIFRRKLQKNLCLKSANNFFISLDLRILCMHYKMYSFQVLPQRLKSRFHFLLSGIWSRQQCRLTLWKYDSWYRRNTHQHQRQCQNYSDTETGTLSNMEC